MTRPTANAIVHEALRGAVRGKHVTETELAKLPTEIADTVRAVSARLVGMAISGDLAGAEAEAARVETALHPRLVHAMFAGARTTMDVSAPTDSSDQQMRAYTRGLFGRKDEEDT